MELDSQFPAGEDEQVFAELCREPDSAIPLLQSSDVESALCTGEKRKDKDTQLTVNWTQHPSGCVPVIHNMAATCSVDCKLDLAKLACSTRNTEYNPKGLPGAIMRLVDPKSVALIFDSGKMVVMGTQNESDLKLAARRIAKIIKVVGFPVKFKRFKVVNMLATYDTGFPIRIEGIHFKHALRSYYEPEMFPGLVYRPRNPKVTIMVFVSGKVVLVGAKRYSDLVDGFESLYPSLIEFCKWDALNQDQILQITTTHNLNTQT